MKLLGDLPVGSGTFHQAALAARYLSKYLAKDLGEGGQPAGLHRYEVAEGFQPAVDRLRGASSTEVLAKASERMGAEPVDVWDSATEPTWTRPHAIWARWA